MEQFTEQELISFGNYLLSKKRKDSFSKIRTMSPERMAAVTAADFENWKHMQEQPQTQTA